MAHVTPLDPAYQEATPHLSELFMQQGHPAGEALRMAQGIAYDVVQSQAAMLAFLDDFRFLAVGFLLLVPLIFLMRKPEGTGAAPALH